MKLSTKMRYGSRAMLDIALHTGDEPVPAGEIAGNQEVSVKYLEHLLSGLNAAGLVRSTRGPRGGYVLSRPAEEINLRHIYEALEGPDSLVECTANPSLCDRYDTCVTQEVWERLYLVCMEVLESTSLADLAERAREKQPSLAQ